VQFWFTGVYDPHQDNLKQEFFQELRDVSSNCTGPWVVTHTIRCLLQPLQNT
jgi:hypothetical protein